MSDAGRLHLALWTCAACGREWYTAYPRETGDWPSVEPNFCPYCGVDPVRPFVCRATVLAETVMEAHQPEVRQLLGQWVDPSDVDPPSIDTNRVSELETGP